MSLHLTQDIDRSIEKILDRKYGSDSYKEFERIQEEKLERSELKDWVDKRAEIEISDRWFEYDNDSGFLGVQNIFLSTITVRDSDDGFVDSLTMLSIHMIGRGFIVTEWELES